MKINTHLGIAELLLNRNTTWLPGENPSQDLCSRPRFALFLLHNWTLERLSESSLLFTKPCAALDLNPPLSLFQPGEQSSLASVLSPRLSTEALFLSPDQTFSQLLAPLRDWEVWLAQLGREKASRRVLAKGPPEEPTSTTGVSEARPWFPDKLGAPENHLP